MVLWDVMYLLCIAGYFRKFNLKWKPQAATSSYFYLVAVPVFHHDRAAFSVSGHLWVDAIDAHVTLESVKPSHLSTSSGSSSRHLHA